METRGGEERGWGLLVGAPAPRQPTIIAVHSKHEHSNTRDKSISRLKTYQSGLRKIEREKTHKHNENTKS